MELRIERTPEFMDWFETLTLKDQLQIDSRIQRIRDHGHFGDAKNLGEGLAELRPFYLVLEFVAERCNDARVSEVGCRDTHRTG